MGLLVFQAPAVKSGILIELELFKTDTEGVLSYYGNDLIFEERVFGEPTIDSPYDLVSYYKYINAKVFELWIYEINSGFIIMKHRLKTKKE